MKKLLTLTLISGCLCILQLSAIEVPPRAEMMRMVKAEQFDELEKLMSELRSQKMEFYMGTIPLRVAYDELDDLGNKQSDQFWKDYLAKLEKWKKVYSNSPAPLIVLGKVYSSWAWKARGGGYADTVTDEGWRLMRERLIKARDYLEIAEGLAIKDPEVYRALLQVALGQGWSKEQMDAVFQKGIALAPNYLRLYEAKAYFLLPRWHGESGEWETFAKQVADARGGDEGDILYMFIAHSQAWSEGDAFFQNTRISYGRMKRGYEASLKRRPDEELNAYCYFACIANDRDTAKELFRKINGRWEAGVWSDESKFRQWDLWAANNGSRPGGDYAAASRSSPRNWKAIMLAAVGAWIGLLLIIATIILLVVRNAKKTSRIQ